MMSNIVIFLCPNYFTPASFFISDRPASFISDTAKHQNLRLHKPASFIIKQFYRPAPYAADG
jgi:hypothetical protein